LLAEGQVIIYRVTKSLLEFFNRRALKGDHVAGVYHLAIKDTGLLVELDCALVALVLHCSSSGVTPASVRKRRIETTAPLSVSFRGWGRWKTALTPRKAIRTLEPLPSLISAPKATNSLSMSLHKMPDFTGSSKIACKVL